MHNLNINRNQIYSLVVVLTTIIFSYCLSEVADRAHRYTELVLCIAIGLTLTSFSIKQKSIEDYTSVAILKYGAALFLVYEILTLAFSIGYFAIGVTDLNFLILKILAILGILVGFRTHSFILVGLFCSFSAKVIILRDLNVGISKSDFLPVLHFFMFISIGIFVNNIFQLKRTEKLLSGYLISIPIGAHIGNYFWSGIEKIRIYDFSFGWILDNDTLNIARAALLNNQLPLELLTGAYTEKFIQSLDSFLTPMNTIVFISQILSVLFLTNKRSLITVTVFFDIFHLSVFVLSGIFFYKWIFLNILIIIYLRKSNSWGGIQKILAVSACLIGFGIHITKLGWHDSNTFYDRYLTKQSDGEELRFPPSMFNYFSLELAQQRMGSTPPSTTNTYGSIINKSITSDFVSAANDCMLNGPDALYTTEWLSEFVRIQRELFTFMDKFNYPKSLFPHHIWSPTEYKNINYQAFADGKIDYKQIKYCFKHSGTGS